MPAELQGDMPGDDTPKHTLLEGSTGWWPLVGTISKAVSGGDSPKRGPMRDVQGNKQTSGHVQGPSETQRPELLSAYQLCVQKGLGGQA